MFRIRCKKRAAGLVGIIFDRVTTFSLVERLKATEDLKFTQSCILRIQMR